MVVTLVVGALIGVIASKGNKSPAKVAQQPTSAPAVNYQQKIRALQDIVSSEANNRNAWVQLGHNYFDSNQPLEAIDAYDKALQLDGNDPNVLTDQGVMYRPSATLASTWCFLACILTAVKGLSQIIAHRDCPRLLQIETVPITMSGKNLEGRFYEKRSCSTYGCYVGRWSSDRRDCIQSK